MVFVAVQRVRKTLTVGESERDEAIQNEAGKKAGSVHFYEVERVVFEGI